MTSLSLSALNEQVTAAVEKKPKHRPKASGELSPGGYWKAVDDATPHGLHWEERFKFTADEGAIQRLIRGKKRFVRVDVYFRDKGCFVIDVAFRKNIDMWITETWDGNKKTPLAPALCCAFLFALDGIRRDVVAGEGEAA